MDRQTDVRTDGWGKSVMPPIGRPHKNIYKSKHTVRLALSVIAIVLGHCPGTCLVHTNAGIANVQNPAIHGTATPIVVIHFR